MNLNLESYQTAASAFALPTAQNLFYLTLGLCSEAGEVAGKVKKRLRGDSDDAQLMTDLRLELGDVLWYLAVLADHMGISLESVAEMNIAKLKARVAAGTIKGDGDER